MTRYNFFQQTGSKICTGKGRALDMEARAEGKNRHPLWHENLSWNLVELFEKGKLLSECDGQTKEFVFYLHNRNSTELFCAKR